MPPPLRLLETAPDFQRLIHEETQDEFIRLNDGRTYATGWVSRPAAVEAFLRSLDRAYLPRTFEQAAPRLMTLYGGTDDSVFNWDAESKVLGRILDSWDQKQVGSCVGFGTTRSAQDIVLNEIADGQPEKWPGYELVPEVTYAFSRVEVGGGGINGDGSVGAWGTKAQRDYGNLLRKPYGNYDLSSYSEARCRQWGNSGVPNELEPEAKLHVVTAVAQVTTEDGLWAALGAKKGVPPCSGQGFATTRDQYGRCIRSGTWNHCMAWRGRFVHPRFGRCVIWQNSWGNYLGGPDTFEYVAADGSTQTKKLPMGCWWNTLAVAAEALREGDTFAMAGFKGWDADPVPPGPGPGPGPQPPTPPGPTPVPLPTSGGISFQLTTPYKADGNRFIASGVCSVSFPKAAGDTIEPPALTDVVIPIPPLPLEFGGEFPYLRTRATAVRLPTGGGMAGDPLDFLIPLVKQVVTLGSKMDPPVGPICRAAKEILDWLYPDVAAATAGLSSKDVLRLVCQYLPYYGGMLPAPVRIGLELVCKFYSAREGRNCSGC